jgi:hypothetical protein
MDTKFYVYVYLREDRYTPYYIGKGTGKRWKQNWDRSVPPPVDRTRIQKVKENLTEQESFELEKTLIKFWGRRDIGTGILRNMTDGGDGISGYKFSEDSKMRMSLSQMGKTLSEEHKKKIGQTLKGRKRKPFTEEHRRKISETMKGMKGHPHTEEHKKNVGDRFRGKPLSEEHKKKISEGWKRRKKGG